jgi:hypothetical protein
MDIPHLGMIQGDVDRKVREGWEQPTATQEDSQATSALVQDMPPEVQRVQDAVEIYLHKHKMIWARSQYQSAMKNI